MRAENFRRRSAMMDEKSEHFLKLLINLGGYCTVAHAEALKLGESGKQARGRLRGLERLGFLRRVAAYPAVYQVTKSSTRHLGRDSGARRRHPLPTVQARLLAVDFYLAARKWPAEFTLDHEHKIATFIDNGCPIHVLPQRGGRPYLREEFLLWPPNGRIAIALIDQAHIGARSQIRGLIRRYLPVMRHLGGGVMDLLMVSGSERRHFLCQRLLQDRRFRATWPSGIPITVKPYWVLRPTPPVAALLCPACHRQEYPSQAPHDHTVRPNRRRSTIHASRLNHKPAMTQSIQKIHCDLID
jgi:hypothetical protein